MSPDRLFPLVGAVMSALAVAAGAFGAHALRTRLSDAMLTVFETAVRYQMYHGLALVAVGLLVIRFPAPPMQWAGWLFAAGTIIFSGSLYALSLSGVGRWGAVTPIGGVLFLAGWICVVWGILRGP